MILAGLLATGIVLLAVAMLGTPTQRGAWLSLAVAAMPLLFTIAVPLLFFLATKRPDDWRQLVIAASRGGIILSFALLAGGIVMTVHAAARGDRRSAVTFAFETALAGLPAAAFSLSLAVFHLL